VPKIKATSNSWFRTEMKDELPRDSSTVDDSRFENLNATELVSARFLLDSAA